MSRPRTPFRSWVHQLWLDNCDERDWAGDHRLNEREYFREFRWWLRREFRHRQQIEQRRRAREAQIQKSIWLFQR